MQIEIISSCPITCFLGERLTDMVSLLWRGKEKDSLKGKGCTEHPGLVMQL